MTTEEHRYVEQIDILKSLLRAERKRSAEIFEELVYWKDTAIRFERRVFVLLEEVERLSKP